MFSRIIFTGLLLGMFGSVAQAAENLALIITNKDYREFSISRDAFEAADLNGDLVDAGFDVRVIRNMSRRAMEQLAPTIRKEIDSASRVLVFISGHVFSTSRESWFVATDAQHQDGLLAGAYGLPISAIVDILGEKAGSSILLVGDAGNPQRLGDGLSYGYVPNNIAQGVTVFSGRTGALVRLVRDELLVPGTSTMAAAEQAPRGVSAFGFLSRSHSFLPVPATIQSDEPIDELELLIWDSARTAGSLASITSYLDRYPSGHFADQANALLTDLQKSPLEMAKDAEAVLKLSRDDRRDIQRNLSLLDYDTRGVDLGGRRIIKKAQRCANPTQNGQL